MSAPVCPCCGCAWVAPLVELDALADMAGLTGVQRVVLEAFRQKPGRAVLTERLITLLYEDDPDGGPLDAGATIRVHAFNLRKRIEPFGWTVRGKSGCNPGYYVLSRVAQ